MVRNLDVATASTFLQISSPRTLANARATAIENAVAANAAAAAEVALSAQRLVSRFAESGAANLSEVKMLLSYVPESEIVFFYDLIEQLVQKYGDSAGLSVAEAKALCKNPQNARSNVFTLESFLQFVVDTVDKYKCSADASVREVKALSMKLQQEELHAYYDLVARISAKHQCLPSKIKLLLSIVGEQGIEDALRGGGRAGCGAEGVRSTRERDSALNVLGFDAKAKPCRYEISRRYRQLAKSWHPDKLRGGVAMKSSLAPDGDRFREIKAATDLLLATESSHRAF